MRAADSIRLIVLAAIWGGSFIFMRVVAPSLGAIVTADLRVLIAGLSLIGYFAVLGFNLDWRAHWKEYAVIGVVNSAIPFTLFSFAAKHIPASYSVILNSTSPFFGAAFSSLWLNDKLTGRKVAAMILGACGVALVTRVGGTKYDSMFLWSILACLAAAMCYGLSGVYVKKHASHIKPKAIAGGSQMMAGLALLPLAFAFPPAGEITVTIAANVVALAILCSAVAYLLYFRLIADLGPTKALTVTFLMPAFGMIWGIIFLGETVTISMIAGCLLIISGTYLIIRK